MAKLDPLQTYKNKRRLDSTPEPAGSRRRPAKKNKNSFVIQMHDASRLHYDFRLEIGGTLKSWAVPKGPSTNPQDKRLAVLTEDHPLEYASFEGVIPKGNYGAGTVMVWDRGTFENITEKKGKPVPSEEAFEHGHLVVNLNGEKLKGAYALTRMGNADAKNWLLIKTSDEHADARRSPVNSKTKSVLSGRTLRQIEKAG